MLIIATSESRCEICSCIIPERLPEINTPDSCINTDLGSCSITCILKVSLCLTALKKKKNKHFKHHISKNLLSDTLCLTKALTHRSVPERRRSPTTYLNDRQMAKKFTATPLRLVSPWKLFFFSAPRSTLRTCCKTISPRKASHPYHA